MAATADLESLPGVGPATADELKSTVRLSLRNSKGTKRIVRLVDAPSPPDGEAVMPVEGEGLKPE